MQNEMENGGKLFFDLFVAMVNHMVRSSLSSPHPTTYQVTTASNTSAQPSTTHTKLTRPHSGRPRIKVAPLGITIASLIRVNAEVDAPFHSDHSVLPSPFTSPTALYP
jgi:hypothetical protein